MTTGELIRRFRKAASWSVGDLATEVGVAPSTIYRIESGEIKSVKAETLSAIAAALDVPYTLLMDIEEEDEDAAFPGDDGTCDPGEPAADHDVHAVPGADRADVIHQMRERIALYVAQFALSLGKHGSGFFTDEEIFHELQNNVSTLVEDLFPESGPESYFEILMKFLNKEDD